jgi:hypothetical protein
MMRTVVAMAWAAACLSLCAQDDKARENECEAVRALKQIANAQVTFMETDPDRNAINDYFKCPADGNAGLDSIVVEADNGDSRMIQMADAASIGEGMPSCDMRQANHQQQADLDPKRSLAVKDSISKAVKFLRTRIAEDGSSGSDVAESGIQAKRAMTALCGLAHLAGWQVEALDKPDSLKQAPESVAKCLQFLLAAPCNRKALRGNDVWGNIWTLDFLTEVCSKTQFAGSREKIEAKIRECVAELSRRQGPDGGWAYYDHSLDKSPSYLAACGILVLMKTKNSKLDVPAKMVDRAVACLKASKQEDGTFSYRAGERSTVEGSCARAPMCETALQLSGEGSAAAVELAVENLFKYRHLLFAIKGKRGGEMGVGGTAPFYYLFGHYACARAIHVLDRGKREGYLVKIADLIRANQQADGSFWDWPLTKADKEYGTALGVLILFQTALR